MIQPTNILATVSAAAKLKPALLVLALILAAMVISCIVFTLIYARTNKGGKLLLGTAFSLPQPQPLRFPLHSQRICRLP